MMQKKISNKQAKIIIVLLISFGFGGLLAKAVPMEAGGFSNLFKKEADKTAVAAKKSKTTTTKAKQPVVQLTYTEQVNKEMDEGKYTGHLPLHLQLQTDDKWKDAAYGMGNPDGDTLGINGCAIASLAMVATYMDKKETTPLEVLQWSGNTYFMEGQGTAWSIFSAYADQKGYVCQDLGADITAVEEHLKAGNPVIVSVKPGYFTTTGHIMVMSGTDNNGNFWIDDPNDSAEKGHSKRTYTADEVMNEAVNFWAFYK